MTAAGRTRLEQAFASGALLRPDPRGPTTVALARALATLGGVSLSPGPGERAVLDAVTQGGGEPEHLVMVLVDGLGLAQVEALGPGSFLRAHVALELRAVFPSTTACALTSLATGAWPAEHAVVGWWTRLPRHGLTATILPFVERFTREPLAVAPAEAFPVPPLLPRYRSDVLSITPAEYVDSVYSRVTRGDTPVLGYGGLSLARAFAAVRERVAAARAPTYTYVYYPEVDAAGHAHGPFAEPTRRKLEDVDARLGALATDLRGRARLVVSADHGMIEVPDGARHHLERDDPLLAHLEAPPSGEPRVPLFHVRPGAAAAFRDAFEARLGERFALLTKGEVDEMRLLGPEPLADATRERLGDFAAVSLGRDVLLLAEEKGGMRGFHAGPTPDEVRIPLVVA